MPLKKTPGEYGATEARDEETGPSSKGEQPETAEEKPVAATSSTTTSKPGGESDEVPIRPSPPASAPATGTKPASTTPATTTTPTTTTTPKVDRTETVPTRSSAETKAETKDDKADRKAEPLAKSPAESPASLPSEPVANPSDLVPLPTELSPLHNDDLYFFNEGTNFRIYEKFGSRPMVIRGVAGVYFALWAPDTAQASVVGNFNEWNPETNPMQARGDSGVWECFIPGLEKGCIYKYHILSRFNNYRVLKSDPFGVHSEVSPKTASVVWDLEYAWGDEEWMKTRRERNAIESPIAIYEMHFGSWMRVPEEGDRFLSYREMAPKLVEYVRKMGFTHVEFLPLMEHPFYGSWGYQVTGYFAPTSRYGTPQDLMYLIDTLHQNGIGVILDWVPSHFATDQHGLGYFDGTHLYEHSYPQKGWHPDWQSYIFNYGRHEVRSFLLSNALYWFDKFHIDGLRVDAVASMLYLDYSRKDGEWMPNQHGGRENIEAIWFLRRFNEIIFEHYPDVQTIAEESTDWSMVSRPTYVGGLGFGLKWDMGWMHDTLMYMSRDAIYRKYHHNEMTFRMLYAFTENFTLPLSHDEVVHGKGSLLAKMPGDLWQKFANLRLLFGYMYAQPGKKLLFMGAEFGQWKEWQHEESIEWHLLQFASHVGLQRWVADLNTFYRNEPALHELDCDPNGFRWSDCNDWENSMFSLIRQGKTTNAAVLAVANFTPVPRHQYRVGVPYGGFWRESLNSDAREYEGSGVGNAGGVEAEEIPVHGFPYSIPVSAPPLGVVFFTNPGPPPQLEDEVEEETKAARPKMVFPETPATIQDPDAVPVRGVE